MSKKYQDKLDNINCWVEIVNIHWDRLRGEMYNDPQFWDDTLHAMGKDDWWDWIDIEPALAIQYAEAFRKYPKCHEATEEVKRIVMLGKDVIRKNHKGKNFTGFRALMNIKDVINEINGTPTRIFRKEEPLAVEDTETQFEKLFDFK